MYGRNSARAESSANTKMTSRGCSSVVCCVQARPSREAQLLPGVTSSSPDLIDLIGDRATAGDGILINPKGEPTSVMMPFFQRNQPLITNASSHFLPIVVSAWCGPRRRATVSWPRGTRGRRGRDCPPIPFRVHEGGLDPSVVRRARERERERERGRQTDRCVSQSQRRFIYMKEQLA